MIVKVIIKRDVIEGKEHDFFSHLKNLRFAAMDQPGYISGETLICAEDTNKVVIISKWENIEDWKAWKSNPERIAIDKVLNEYQANPTIYEPYVFSKYKVAAKQGFPPPLQEKDLSI